MLFDDTMAPSSAVSPPGNRFAVTNQNATADSTADTITPLYSAPMIEPPALTLTKNAPTIEATIDTAPSTSGYNTALVSAANIRQIGRASMRGRGCSYV